MSDDKRNEKVYRAVSGRSPKTEPKPAPTVLDFHQSLNLLYGRVKSQNQLAGMLGVPRRTLRRWLGGETPGRTAQDRQRRDLVEGSAARLIRTQDDAALVAVRRGRLSLNREAKIRGAHAVEVDATLRYGDGDDHRKIRFTIGGGFTGLAPGVMDAAVDAYLNGATTQDGPQWQNHGGFAPIVDAMTDPQGDDGYPGMFRETEPDALGFDVTGVRFI